jgi:hypothetical protein
MKGKGVNTIGWIGFPDTNPLAYFAMEENRLGSDGIVWKGQPS